jgi:hypothetical protein
MQQPTRLAAPRFTARRSSDRRFTRPGALVALLGAGLAGTFALEASACSKHPESRGAVAAISAQSSLGGGAPATGQAAPVAAAAAGGGAPAGAAAGGAATVAGPGLTTVADTASYQVQIEVPAKVAAGAEAAVKVVVVPKSGWKMNKEFPAKLNVRAPGDVVVARPSMTAREAVAFADRRAEWAVVFSARSPGEKQFSAQFKFAVCTDATCDPKKEDLAWKVAVK